MWHHTLHRVARLRHDEASNSFALFVVMLPMIMAAFGIGLDMSRNVFIRNQLQNSLDMATVSGAGVTDFNQESGVRIDTHPALEAVEKLYAINRSDVGGVDCWGDQADLPGTDLPRCWKVNNAPSVTATSLTYTARERSLNAFLPVVGIKWQKYTIVSTAVINQSGE